ncbi:hypothetical protein CUC08_Gglean002353 [Alternaria sp. MG1]|nr:hypothetical protein CUC08_Gglean002353 [Alternaria sp. MG1]
MHDAAAHALLRKKLRDADKEDDDDSIAELATTLDHMPLALVQAAAYIRERAPRCSVRQYLEAYRQSDSRATSLLNREAGHLRRDATASNSVLITWQISFDHIRSIRQSAADLLSLMSFFDRQGIPEALFRVQDGEAVCDDVASAGFDDEFEDDILMLRDYSLVTVAADEKTFEMHSLVQLATRQWLQGQDEASVWLEVALEVLAAAFPSGQPETWATCRILFPHTTKVLGQMSDTNNEARLDCATIATNAAWYLMLTGEYANAEYNARIAVTGKHGEAEVMHRRALKGYEDALGREHPDTLTSVSQLGSALEGQGKCEEAQAMYRRVLEGSEKVLGRQHPDTILIVNDFGLLLERQGKYDEAEAMHRRALQGYENALGQEHPYTLSSVNNLGSVLSRQGEYAEAVAMHQRALEGRKKVLGPEHPHTLISAKWLSQTRLK